MREYLSLPPEIVPATLKKQVRASAEVRGDDNRRERGEGRREGGRGGFGGRDGYRGGEGKGGAPGEYNPEFRGGGGFGRGSGMPR